MKRKTNDKLVVSVVNPEDVSDVSDSEDTYTEKVKDLKRQLKLLEEKTHPDYLKVKRKAESWLTEEKQRVQMLHEHRIETVVQEYEREVETCNRDCKLEKRRIQDYLVSLCEELKRRLEHDKKNIELTPSGDILDFKPAVTRKLRRRAGTDLPSTGAINFMYWGDSLLCGSWPLNATTTTTAFKTNSSDPAAPNSNELRSPTFSGNAGADMTSVELTNDQTEFGDSTRTTRTGEPGGSNATKTNLFGSLGLNPFDGSLVSHLLASINTGGASPYGIPGAAMLLSGSASGGLGNYLTGTTSSPAAAITTGLVPSGLAAALALNLAGAACQPASAKRRRQQNAAPTAQLNLLLPENDIYADLTIIHKACSKAAAASGTTGPGGSSRKNRHHHHSNTVGSGASPVGSPSQLSSGQAAGSEGSSKGAKDSGTPTLGSPGSAGVGSPIPFGAGCDLNGGFGRGLGVGLPGSTTGPSIWIDDGRLYCGQKCYQYGASVIVEGRDGSSHRCSGTIAAVGAQDVSIRRSSDHSIFRITVQQLKQGRYVLWPGKT